MCMYSKAEQFREVYKGSLILLIHISLHLQEQLKLLIIGPLALYERTRKEHRILVLYLSIK